MGNALIALAIVLGGIASCVILFVALWQPLSRFLETIGNRFKRELDLSDVMLRPESVGFVLLGITLVVWFLFVVLTRPGPVDGLLALVFIAAFTVVGLRTYLRIRIARRTRRFGDQLETLMRMLAGAIRVGLGLRQALIQATEQSDEPARRELTRVVGATNLGVSLVDALDDLADRIKIPETQMLARVIRVQAQTGGDLAAILDGLADTIRDRRRFYRKVRAMTAYSRGTAWFLGLMPLAVGLFVLSTQPDMREASFATSLGRTGLLVAATLDALAVIFLLRIARIDV